MMLTHSRRRARVGADGELVLLADQDRSLWDADEIRRGLELARRAAAGGPAAGRTRSRRRSPPSTQGRPPAADTDWPRIARLYPWLAEFDPSPVVELNRAVAVAEAQGPDAGLEIIGSIEGLDGYQPLHVARADLLRRTGDPAGAADAYRRAIELSSNPVQRSFLEQRLAGSSVLILSRCCTRLRSSPPTSRPSRSRRGPLRIRSIGSDRVPLGAEQLEPVAGRVTGLGVPRVQVERMAVVGDLLAAVVPLDRRDQRLVGAVAGLGVTRRRHRRPFGCALAAAVGRAVLVLLEQVDGVAVAVGQDLPEVGVVGDVDRRRSAGSPGARGRGRRTARRGRGGRARAGGVPAATAGCGEREGGEQGDGRKNWVWWAWAFLSSGSLPAWSGHRPRAMGHWS